MRKLLSIVLCLVLLISAVPFCVSAGYKEDHASTTFSVSKDTYAIGETVTFNFENALPDDWIAIYKDGYTPSSGVSYVAWIYATGTGSIDFPGSGWTIQYKDFTNLNTIAGSYTATLYYYGTGNPISSVKFKIAADKTELVLEKDTIYNDEPVSVRLSGCQNAQDWVGLYKKGGKDNEYMDYIYYKNTSGEKATFSSGETTRFHYADNSKPGVLEPGEYDFVLYENNGYTELDRKSFKVIDRSESTDPYFTFVEDHYTNKTPITVQLHNCKNDKDWIGIYKAGTSGSAYLKYIYKKDSNNGLCTFPCYDPGSYTLILFENDTYKVLSQRTFTVEAVIDPQVKTVNDVVYSDEFLSIEVEGCKDNDWIALYKDGATRYMDWIYYTDRASNNTYTFPTPANWKRAYYDIADMPGYLTPGKYMLKIHDYDTSEVLYSYSFTVVDRVTNTIYLSSENGSDSYKGTSSAFPAKTYETAAKNLVGDDVMIFAAGNIDLTGIDARDGLTTVVGTDKTVITAAGTAKSDTSFINVTFDTADDVIGDGGHKLSFSGCTLPEKKDYLAEGSLTVDGAVCGVVTVKGSEFIAENSSAEKLVIAPNDASLDVKVYVGGEVGAIEIADGALFNSCEIITRSSAAPSVSGNTDKVWFVNTTANTDLSFTDTVGTFGAASPADVLVYAEAADGTAVYAAKDGAAEAIAPVMTPIASDYAEYINYRKPLANTYRKLTVDKELNVVFFGGSVTAGYGSSNSDLYSWRGRTTTWLKENFKDAKLNIYNEAAGESGTYLGSFRLKRDVLSHEPDLIFLEYSINDKYYGSGYNKASYQYETIVREIKEAYPTCDIVTVLVTDWGASFAAMKVNGGKLHTEAQAHEDMAVKYNIPTIHVGRALVDTLPANMVYETHWKDVIMLDTVHPLDSGYETYYKVVHEFLVNSLLCTSFNNMPTAYDEIQPVVSDHLFDGRDSIMPSQAVIDASNKNGGHGFTFVNASYDYLKNSGYIGYLNAPKGAAEDAVLTVEFDGTEMSLLTNFYNESAIKVSVDGGAYTEKACEAHNPAKVVSGLTSGHHVIRIIPVFKSGSPNMHIGAIYTYDAAKETQKGTTFTYDDRKNGIIALPAGLYTISEKATALSADELTAPDKDGYIFCGWFDENDALAEGAIEDGGKAVAQYIPTDTYLAFCGVSMRTAEAEGGKADFSGLRFMADLDKALYDDTRFIADSYGMVLLPSALLGDTRSYTDYDASLENCVTDIIGAEKLVIGGSVNYADTDYAVGEVPAEKLFAEDDNSVQYTTCVTGIAAENFGRYYTVKAYLHYTDVYGCDRVAYSAPFRSSVYEVAEAAKADVESSDALIALAGSIIESVIG